VAQAARDLGVGESVLGRWKQQLAEDPGEAFPGKGHLKSQDEELRQLRRENALLRMERDILKKWLFNYVSTKTGEDHPSS
jgi:transposase